ncbi:MAG: transketolase [Magnetococcales bacterium]|nr:transketolase [Magnetococcales bacterium]HIJ83219.1 transketolase [Magnetococcales bacterium]
MKDKPSQTVTENSQTQAFTDLDRRCVNTLRMLAVDQVEQARSGHPGMPMGSAPMAYVLWSRIMRYNPKDPSWPDRDRFILSPGHGSSLLYALLYMTGFGLELEELRQFRQWGSRTPGHPEYGVTPGVETTTGPLGQGFAMGVGMAIAERHLAQNFNRQEFLPVVDHFTYAIVSDGDLMVGLGCEAASLAGHLCLGKLIYLYDDNRVTIDGPTSLTFSEDVKARFESYQWQVLRVEDGEDLDAIERAVRQAQAEEERPSLIMVRTQIGYGSPKAGTSASHGAPLGPTDMAVTRNFFDWPETPFHVPPEALEHLRKMVDRGREHMAEWEARMGAFSTRFPEEAQKLRDWMAGILPKGWDEGLYRIDFGGKMVTTRQASGKALNALARRLPSMIGGSADLTDSNQTWIWDSDDRYIHYGIREHAMGAITNGIARHGGTLPFCGTFLVFSDYMRGAIRMAAVMGTHVVFILSHDSIGVGEDGPTHQPIEHVMSLRLIPHLTTLRPADAFETAGAWKVAIANKRPVALCLTRQAVPVLTERSREMVAKGAYILDDCEGDPDLIIMASGSEVHIAVETKQELAKLGHGRVRVISMPSWELFKEQPESYREEILPKRIHARLGIEAGVTLGWREWVGNRGDVVGLNRFGASAPYKTVMEELGISVKVALEKSLNLLQKNKTN